MDNHRSIGKPGRGTITLISFLVLVSVCLLPGCSPNIVEKVRTEYVYRDVHHRDTTIQHDSTYIREYVKGDTVHHYEYRDRYVYRDRWRDSIQNMEIHDTTFVDKLVEKPLSKFKQAKLDCFWWLVCSLFVCLGWIFRKPIVKLIKSLI